MCFSSSFVASQILIASCDNTATGDEFTVGRVSYGVDAMHRIARLTMSLLLKTRETKGEKREDGGLSKVFHVIKPFEKSREHKLLANCAYKIFFNSLIRPQKKLLRFVANFVKRQIKKSFKPKAFFSQPPVEIRLLSVSATKQQIFSPTSLSNN